MKKILLAVLTVCLISFVTAPTISKKERKVAINFLRNSENNVVKLVNSLNEAQLKFKPSPEKWSVEEIMMHIAASEKLLQAMVADSVKAPANPEKRSQIKLTDEQVMTVVEDRTQKVKTFPPLEPPNTGFKTAADAIASFQENRAKLVEYVKSTNDDLRNHVVAMGPGHFDAYQMLLFIGAHGNRHMNQMREVMADPGFPK